MTRILSVKNTGLSGNMLKFLIIYDFCKKHDIEMVFPCSDSEKKILLNFKHIDLDLVSFPGYIASQKSIFNEKARVSLKHDYETHYKEFIKQWYPFTIRGELVYKFGNLNSIELKPNQTVLLDYNDGLIGYESSLKAILEPYKFDPIVGDNYIFRYKDDSIASFNLKTSTLDEFDEERRYWVNVVESYLKIYKNKSPFFVSGNNEMKYHLCKHFGVDFKEIETEFKLSIRDGGELSRGKSESVMIDIQNCVNTDFVSLNTLVSLFKGEGLYPGDNLFRVGKAEKFDVLVNFFKSRSVI